MSQQIINLGVGPDSQTGDSLYVAFNKVNTNFTELYSVFDGNGVTTLNANVIYSNNIVTSVNVRTGNLFAYGNIESIGYVITSGVFYPNGIPVGSLSSIDSNLVPVTSNLYTVGNVTNQFTQGYFSSNITLAGANVTVRNGMLYVNGGLVEANYSNANVASYLPVYNGNIAATVTTASQPYITSLGTLTGLSVSGNTVISGNLDVSGTVTYLNVRDFSVQDPIITLNTGPNGAPLLSNNSFDSGVRTYYYDSENRAAFFGRANDTGYFEYYSNVISETGNIISGTYGTVKTGNLVLTGLANITGNVTGSYFLGNGRYLTGIDATLISDGTSNVKVYSNGNVAISSTGVSNVAVFTPIGGNINGDFFITGTIKALNYIGNVQGNLSAPGLDTQVLFNDNSTVGATTGFTFNKTANTVSVGGNINSLGNINVAGYKVIDSTGNIVTSRLVDSGVTADTYGNASAVPVITVDSKGRITSASTTAVAGVNNVTYNSLTGNLTVFTSAGNNFSVDIGVGTADSPIFSGLSVDGNTIVNGLSINTSATIGTTLGVVGNLIAANLNTAGTANVGQVDVAGYNVIDSTGNVVTSRLIDSGVVAGTYGNASAVPVITVDSKGRITSANTTAVAGVSGLSYSTLTGNLTISTSAGTTYSVDLNVGQEDTPTFANAIIDSFLTVYNTANVGQLKVNGTTVIDTSGEVVTSQLKNSGVTAGIYGNAGIVPVFSVDSKGRVDGVTNVAIDGISIVSYNSSNGNLSITSKDGTARGVDIGVGTSDSPIFAGLSVAGNTTVNALTVNNSATIGGTLGVTSNATIGNISTNNLTVSGIIADNITVSNVSLSGGLQNTPVGNAIASTGKFTTLEVTSTATVNSLTSNGAVSGTNAQFTTINGSANAIVNALTVNNSTTIGSTLGVTGNINGNGITLTGSLTASGSGDFDGGLQSTPIGNVAPSTAIFTTESVSGNSTVNALTVNNSATIGGTLGVTGNATVGNVSTNNLTVSGIIAGNITVSNVSLSGGLQNTPVGNAIPSTGNFTSLNTDGNLTAAGVTSNGSITAGTTLSATAGIQATAIGNITPSTGNFTTASISGNVTTNELTVNNSATIGSSLGVAGNVIVGNIRTAGTVLITNTTNSTGANTGALIVQGGASFEKDIHVLGNVYTTNLVAINANTLSVTDPLLYLTATSPYPYNYDIGVYSQFNSTVGNVYQHTGFVRDVDDNTWKLFSNVIPEPGITIDFANAVYDPLKTGTLTVLGQIIGNSSLSVFGTATVGNLVSNGTITGGSINISNAVISGNLTVNGLTVNTSAVVGSTLQAVAGIQNTAIGNVTTSTGAFTTVQAATIGNSGAVFTGDTYTATSTFNGPLNGTLGSAGGNTAIVTTLSATGNATVSALTVNGSAVVGTTLQSIAGIQATAIGNITPGTGNFTSLNTSGNLVAAGLVSNSSITAVTTISGLGGLQNTPIGNVTPSTAVFTSESVSGNSTVNALTVNSSATIGSTLGVVGNINGSSATLSGSLVTTGTAQYLGGLQDTPIGNVTASSALFTTIGTSGNITLGSGTGGNISGANSISSNIIIVTGNATVGNLTTAGNISASFLFGNGSQLTGIDATSIQNGNSNVRAYLNGPVTVSSAGIANVLVVTSTSVNSTANITAPALTSNGSITAQTTLSALGGIQATPIGNVTASSGQFTSLSATGNVTGAALTSNGSITAQTTLSALGGIQATPIGNVAPSTAIFTSLSVSGNITANALTVNNSATVGGTLGITGNISGSGITLSGSGVVVGSLQARGGLQDTPIGNAVPSTAQFTTLNASGNLTANGLTINGSGTFGSTLSASGNITATTGGFKTPHLDIGAATSNQISSLGNPLLLTTGNGNSVYVAVSPLQAEGGLQSTPIGNTTASTGQFTTVSATGNVTGAALTSNTSITAQTTLSAMGGLQATPIGNVTPSTAIFTSESVSGNSTVNALTVNNSATIGTTLGVTGNATIGNISSVGRIISNDTTDATGVGTGAFIVVGGGSVTKDFWVGGNLYTTNLIATSTSNISVQDPLLYLTANAPYPYSYEIGFYSQFSTTSNLSTYQHTGFIRDHTDNVWKLVSNVAEPNTTVDFTNANVVYDSIKTGPITALGAIVGNSTGSFGSNVTVNGLTVNTSAVVNGSVQSLGGLQATPIGNVTPSTALFTTVGVSSNATVNALTVNNSATVGLSLGVGSNVNADGMSLTNSATIVRTLQAAGGIQATPIGNVTPSTALFTTVGTSGNTTVAALTVNGAATVGTTLGVTGNLNIGGLSTSGNVLGRSQLLLGVTNDTYGPQYLRMQNRDGQNGPLFDGSSSSVALVDFSFKTANAQRNIRFETRGGGTKYISSSDGYEFQIGQFTGSPTYIENPYVVIANTGLLVRTSTVSTSTSTGALMVQGGAGVTGNVTAGNVTTAGIIRATATTAATSNVTGAVIVSGGVGVAGNVYVGQRVGFVAANSVSAVYQVYNAATNSLDTIFG